MRTEGHWLWVLIKPNFWSNFTEQKISENRPILADKRSALTLIYLATSKSLQSLSYQFRLYLVGVLYIVKWCWSAINDRLENMFIELPNCRESVLNFQKIWATLELPSRARCNRWKTRANRNSVSLRIQSECGKMWTRITSNTDTFYADAGFNSKVNDSGIWNKCSLLQAIGDRSVNLPEDDYLTNDCKLP